ncbi:MAG: T9SS type A sorting domain-containing protein, partial [Bacteroidota bacterium]
SKPRISVPKCGVSKPRRSKELSENLEFEALNPFTMKSLQIFLFLLFQFAAFQVRAAHIIGGQLSYACLGGNEYQFTLTLFRDCASGGAPFDAPGGQIGASVTFYEGTNTIPFDVIQLGTPLIEPLTLASNCPPSLCVEKGTYTWTSEVPNNAQSFHVVYQRCCRNNTISNMIAPGETGMTFTITISPQAKSLCNRSPVFENIPMVCSGVWLPFSFDHAATDPDGDSLVYEFCVPLHGGGTDQQNATLPNGVAPDPDLPPPFSPVSLLVPASQPIPGIPPFSIDTLSGLVSGTPTNLGLYQYAICVKEIRNGQVLSESRFEFQHSVVVATSSGEAKPEAGWLRILANPWSGEMLQFEVVVPKELPAEVALLDLAGRQLVGKAVQFLAGKNSLAMEADLPPGIYFLRLQGKDFSWVEKVIKLE